MAVLTLFFAGTSHDLEHDIEDDSMVWAYGQVTPPKAYFAGPGKTKVITFQHVGEEEQTERVKAPEVTRYSRIPISSTGNVMTGKGWNRNVWHAIKLIHDYVVNRREQTTVNIVGHSRGSITVIMLLNDLFFERITRAPRERSVREIEDYRIESKTFHGSEGSLRKYEQEFVGWYKERLKLIWAKRLGSTNLAEEGLEFIAGISDNINRLTAINAYLFDPVGGMSRTNTQRDSRKMDFPYHPKIQKVRVLRMEHGSKMLSDAMPIFTDSFKGEWRFLSGEAMVDLFEPSIAKEIIPLPGSHGAGLSVNFKGTQPTTHLERYLGTSYMLHLLKECGTRFNTEGSVYPGPGDFCNEAKMLYAYNELMKKWKDVKFYASSRKQIHSEHHTFTKEENKKHWYSRKKVVGYYAGDSINGHHRWLKEICTPEEFIYTPLVPQNK
jgi:hypothetical protein